MIQEPLPDWPNVSELAPAGFMVPFETLQKLGDGDAALGRRRLRAMIDVEMVHEPVDGPTARPMNVRLATVADESSLFELLRLDVRENASHIAPVDDGALFTFIQSATRDIHNLGAAKPIIGVIGTEDHIEGAIFIQMEKWFWSSDVWFLQEKLVAVHPDCRRSRHAADLLKFARWFSDAMSEQAGCRVRLLSNVVATVDALFKQALFGRLLNRIGSVYTYPSPLAGASAESREGLLR